MPDHKENRGISLQPRDIEILKSLLESRVMTIRHASILHFQGRFEASKKRTLRLRRAGLISVRARRPFEPAVLFLSRKGLQILDSSGLLPEIPEFSLESFVRRSAVSDRTLCHELDVMDVKVAFAQSVVDHKQLRLDKFGTWPNLHRFQTHLKGRPLDAWIKPDGYMSVSSSSHSGQIRSDHFYLELDRSTESLGTLIEKCRGYLAHRKSTRPNEVPPFRVLVVLKTSEREANLLVKLTDMMPPIKTLVWTSIFEKVIANPLGAIWTCPADSETIAATQRELFADRQKGLE